MRHKGYLEWSPTAERPNASVSGDRACLTPCGATSFSRRSSPAPANRKRPSPAPLRCIQIGLPGGSESALLRSEFSGDGKPWRQSPRASTRVARSSSGRRRRSPQRSAGGSHRPGLSIFFRSRRGSQFLLSPSVTKSLGPVPEAVPGLENNLKKAAP
jgi:hypothetical protein